MIYYKTGEFAKRANVSIRTIRYYDNEGLLKPSLINESGYRLYTDFDFIKLQKILSLKYLGFSLEDIFVMTANDSYISLQESLKLQMKLINQKITQLQDVQSSLLETFQLLNQEKDIDWSEIIKKIQMNSMERDLIEQYKNATNVDIRIRLHEKYSQNPLTWFRWLFSFYQLDKNKKILEIGCGNGQLWLENKSFIAGDIVISDISQGMVNDAKENTQILNNISYQCFDCQSMPYEDNTFDIIIANHVLFYVKDIDRALMEIKRVLKPGGYLYCTAYGRNHMREITDLVKEYDTRITLSNLQLYDVFGLENGYQLLSPYFDNVTRQNYEDSLEVANMDDISNYILSCHGNQSEYISNDYSSFKKFIERKTINKETFHITKEACLFICKNNK